MLSEFYHLLIIHFYHVHFVLTSSYEEHQDWTGEVDLWSGGRIPDAL